MNTAFPDPILQSSLSLEEIGLAVQLLLRQDISDESKGRFLSDLHGRGETAQELAGFASILLEKGVKPSIERHEEMSLVELCGTGGDQAGLLNISTAAMFVVAGAGVRVVKHGNRAVSSRCGSADVLEALGVELHLLPERVNEVLDRAGCVFMLASDFHPAVAAVAPVRRVLAARGQMTIFNLLGPLLNPACPDFQLTGVYSREVLDLYAEALHLIGRRAAWAVYGEGRPGESGFDELSVIGLSHVASFREGVTQSFVIDPFELGFSGELEGDVLLGGDAAANASRIVSILSGEEKGAARGMILLNAAAAIHVTGRTKTLPEAITIARESIDSGSAEHSLNLLRFASEGAVR